MNLSLQIAKAYLLGKKNTNAINIIIWVSILGMSIGTTALILILSVFNGFEGVLSGIMKSFKPDLTISPLKGKYLELSGDQLVELRKIPGVHDLTRSIEEVAIFQYNDSQEVGYIKGVESNYQNVTDIDSLMTIGSFVTNDENVNYGVLGFSIFNKLSVNTDDAITPISIYVPKRGSIGAMSKSFKMLDIYPSGVFSVGGDEDAQYIFTSFDFVNKLLNIEGKATSVEFKIDVNLEQSIRRNIIAVIGNDIVIKNRYEQDESFLRIMNIEKWISYLIAVLTLIIIAFNLIGSLWMIVLDKKKDISILKSMGFTSKKIKNVFILIGTLIGCSGLVIGLGISMIVYVLQKNYALITVPDGFLITAYPIELKLIDLFIVVITVITIAFLASIIPAKRAAKVSAFVRQE